jgi:hypothetical protein
MAASGAVAGRSSVPRSYARVALFGVMMAGVASNRQNLAKLAAFVWRQLASMPNLTGRASFAMLLLMVSTATAVTWVGNLQGGRDRDLGATVASVMDSLAGQLESVAQRAGAAAASLAADAQDQATNAVSSAVTAAVLRAHSALDAELERRLGQALSSALRIIESAAIDPDMPIAVQRMVQQGMARVVPRLKETVTAHVRRAVRDRMVGPLERDSRSLSRPTATSTPMLSNALSPAPRWLRSLQHPPPSELNAPAEWDRAKSPAAQHPPSGVENLSWFHAARGWILYTISPFDRNVWSCAKDPYWWLFTIVGAMPVIGQVWWVLLFCLHDRTDEGRLSDFVVSFAASFFVSAGLIPLLMGTASLHVCTAWMNPLLACSDTNLPPTRWVITYLFERLLATVTGDAALVAEQTELFECPSCAVYGPRASLIDALFFLLQVSLVWTAYGLLPYTRRLVRPGLATQTPLPAAAVAVHHPWYGAPPRSRGGELLPLFMYFSAVTVLCVGAVVLWVGMHGVSWQTLGFAYWIRCLFGLLALPFVIFKVPVIGPLLLLRSELTGYDKSGRVVLRT